MNSPGLTHCSYAASTSSVIEKPKISARCQQHVPCARAIATDPRGGCPPAPPARLGARGAWAGHHAAAGGRAAGLAGHRHLDAAHRVHPPSAGQHECGPAACRVHELPAGGAGRGRPRAAAAARRSVRPAHPRRDQRGGRPLHVCGARRRSRPRAAASGTGDGGGRYRRQGRIGVARQETLQLVAAERLPLSAGLAYPRQWQQQVRQCCPRLCAVTAPPPSLPPSPSPLPPRRPPSLPEIATHTRTRTRSPSMRPIVPLVTPPPIPHPPRAEQSDRSRECLLPHRKQQQAARRPLVALGLQVGRRRHRRRDTVDVAAAAAAARATAPVAHHAARAGQ